MTTGAYRRYRFFAQSAGGSFWACGLGARGWYCRTRCQYPMRTSSTRCSFSIGWAWGKQSIACRDDLDPDDRGDTIIHHRCNKWQWKVLWQQIPNSKDKINSIDFQNRRSILECDIINDQNPKYADIAWDLDTFIQLALEEDIRSGDIAHRFALRLIGLNARLKVMTMASWSAWVLPGSWFSMLAINLSWSFIDDGARCVVWGHCILMALSDAVGHWALVTNTMQRMSGIATLSDRFASEVSGLPVKILDTRKTKSLFSGTSENGLCVLVAAITTGMVCMTGFMIKDNHIAASGSISRAIKKVNQYQQDRVSPDMALL